MKPGRGVVPRPRRPARTASASDVVSVQCPYCHEPAELYLDPETEGALVEDCLVCCRPWSIVVERSGEDGTLHVHVARAQ